MKRTSIPFAIIVAFAVCMSSALLGSAYGSAESDTFEIQIKIADVQNLYGFDFKLYYNTACLDLIESTPEPPWSLNIVIKDDINDMLGVYRLVAVAVAPALPFDGSATLARLTFRRTSSGTEDFVLDDTMLADGNGDSILHVVNGLVIQAIPVHDIAVTKISAYPRGVYQGDPISVSVKLRNQGNFLETFDVTLYADMDKAVIGDEIIIGVQTVSDLPGKTFKTISFVWDTDNVPYGVYWLSAQATIVPEESDTADNFLKCGDWIGGIYAPPYVRRASETWISLTSVFVAASVTLTSVSGIKKYWFS